MKNGEISNNNEDHKFFKKTVKQTPEQPNGHPADVIGSGMVSPPVGDSDSGSQRAPKPNSCLIKAMLEDRPFKFIPVPPKQPEGQGAQAGDQEWEQHEQHLPNSPEYNKNEECIEPGVTAQEAGDHQDAEVIDKTMNSKASGANSPASMFRHLGNTLRQNSGQRFQVTMMSNLPETLELPSGGETRLPVWETNVEDMRKTGFKLNPITVGDQIMVPEPTHYRLENGGSRNGLTSSLCSERNTRSEAP